MVVVPAGRHKGGCAGRSEPRASQAVTPRQRLGRRERLPLGGGNAWTITASPMRPLSRLHFGRATTEAKEAQVPAFRI